MKTTAFHNRRMKKPTLPILCAGVVPEPRRMEGSVGTHRSPSLPTKTGRDGTIPALVSHKQSSVGYHQQHNSITLGSSSNSPFDAASPAEFAHTLVCPSTLPQVT